VDERDHVRPPPLRQPGQLPPPRSVEGPLLYLRHEDHEEEDEDPDIAQDGFKSVHRPIDGSSYNP